MFISIVTINRNDAIGLRRTIDSVLSQSCSDFEHIIVDGASTDASIEVIQSLMNRYAGRLSWISEPDRGIYDAMNKGLKMAKGEYVQILNSGDILASADVLSRVKDAISSSGSPNLVYGNMIKALPNGTFLCDKGFAGQSITMLGMFRGTINHDSAFIRRELYAQYGLFDENLKICSDWAWFMKSVVLGGEKPLYFDIDISVFDMGGISENKAMVDVIGQERATMLKQCLPEAVISDYDMYSKYAMIGRRISRHRWARAIVGVLDRVLFKIEKRAQNRNLVQKWG